MTTIQNPAYYLHDLNYNKSGTGGGARAPWMYFKNLAVLE